MLRPVRVELRTKQGHWRYADANTNTQTQTGHAVMCGRFILTPLGKVLYQVVQVQPGVSRKPQGQAAVKTTTVKVTGNYHTRS